MDHVFVVKMRILVVIPLRFKVKNPVCLTLIHLINMS